MIAAANNVPAHCEYLCPSGYYFVDVHSMPCRMCDQGFYCDGVHRNQCPEGYNSNKPRSSSPSDCVKIPEVDMVSKLAINMLR